MTQRGDGRLSGPGRPIRGPDRGTSSGQQGSQRAVEADAESDGDHHAVSGTPLMDTIACTRPARHVIASTGKKAGAVTLTDTLTTSPDGQVLTLIYSIFDDAREVAKGTAVFDKRRASH